MPCRFLPSLIALFACLGLLTLAGCTSSSAKTDASPSSAASGDGGLGGGAGETGGPASTAPAPTSAAPTGPITTGGITETPAAACPYVGTQAAADAEGNRIGQVFTLSQNGTVMGCRFRFAYSDFHYTIEITSQRFADDVSAYNAMVTQGSAGGQAQPVTLSTGEQGISYRTTFYAPDGNRDWAYVFAKGPVVVTIKTDQNDISQNAVNLAELVAPKF